jgi:hypothetical protein
MKPVPSLLPFSNAVGSRPNCTGFAARTLPARATSYSSTLRHQRAIGSCISDTSLPVCGSVCVSSPPASLGVGPTATFGFPRTRLRRISVWLRRMRLFTVLQPRVIAEMASRRGVLALRYCLPFSGFGSVYPASLHALRTCQPAGSYNSTQTPAAPSAAGVSVSEGSDCVC